MVCVYVSVILFTFVCGHSATEIITEIIESMSQKLLSPHVTELDNHQIPTIAFPFDSSMNSLWRLHMIITLIN